MKKYIRGFTLIELLVVIAIIGILASVVLVSLNSARKKGNDTRVISDVQQLRTQIETDYNGSNYNASFTAPNTLVATVGTNYATLVADAVAQGGANAIITITNGAAPFIQYAIYGHMVSNTGVYFCIDSTGATNPVAIAHTAAACPPAGS